MTSIVLASASTVRARLLTAAGVAFSVLPARIDEDAVKQALLAEGAGPREIAEHLAELKAIKVSASQPQALVIGSDQVLSFDGELISKSADVVEARGLLRRLAGQTHELFTTIILAKNGSSVWRHNARAELRMREFSDDFLEGYLAAENRPILDSVGCYHLEGRGAQLLSEMTGDYFAILGLPLLPLLTALRQFGALAS